MIEVKPSPTTEQRVSPAVPQRAWSVPGSIRQIFDSPVGAGKPFSSVVDAPSGPTATLC
jgi:hypothetical protein